MIVENYLIALFKRIQEWFLFVNRRFSPHFFHWVVILWKPKSMIDIRHGERIGSIFLIRSGAFFKQEDLKRYLLRYMDFLEEAEKSGASFADYIFREIEKKPVCIIERGDQWSFNEDLFNSVADVKQIYVQVPCLSSPCFNGYDASTDQFDEILDKILGKGDYPFHPASPLIATRYQNLPEDLIIVRINNYPCRKSNIEELLKTNDFCCFQEALKRSNIMNFIPNKSELVYKGIKLLCIIPEWKVILFIPVPVISPKGEEVALIGVVVFSRLSLKEIYQRNIGELDEIVNTILGMGHAFSFGLAMMLATNEVRTHALRSAIAAIMARNMSHNIESHITPRATIEAIRKRFKELDFSESLDIIEVLRGRLDKYRQERADFLAEITSEPLTTTKSISFYRGIILPLIENTLLMDNIARNEGICYRDKTDNRLRIRVFINDSELKAEFKCATGEGSNNIQPSSYVYPPNSSNSQSGYPYSGHCFGCKYKKIAREDHSHRPEVLFGVLTQGNDIEIEVPGPVGEHAFYSFLENFIRNAAKHNRERFDKNQNENLEINIRISEPEDPNERREFYQIEIWDNVTNPNKEINAMFEGKEYKTLYDLIKAYIESDVIDETGRKKEQAYGITEMKVCATLLSGSTNFMDMKEFLKVCKEVRKAINYSQEGRQVTQEERLIYRFRLMKPKKMCGVFPDWSDEELRNSLRDQGIWIFKSVDELKTVIVPGEGSDIPRSAASFRFAVFDCSGENGQEIAEGILELLPYLPFRILVLAGQNSNLSVPKAAHLVNKRGSDMLQNANADEIMVWLWRHWLSRWGNETKIILEIYLDQESNENPTQEWAQYASSFNEMNKEFPFRIRVWSRSDKPVAGDQSWQGTHIIFDRHGGVRGKLRNWQTIEPNLGSQHTYIHLDKLSADFVYVFQKPPSSDFWTLPYELIEAGLLRILVIDERVAEKAAIDQSLSRWLFSYWAKVYICTHFGVDKQPEPLHKKVEEGMDEYLKVSLRDKSINYEWKYGYGEERVGNSLDVDMVIIHQGILDHVKDVNPNFDVEGFLAKLREHIPFVLVDSGRGIPSTLSKNVKFLPFSILNDYILGARIAKYRLAQVTMSLTRKGGK